MPTTFLALPLLVTAFSVAFAALFILGRAEGRRASRLRDTVDRESGAITFLFDGDSLVESSWAARDLLSAGPREGTDWSRLSHLLEPRFPGLAEWIGDLADLGKMERTARDGTSLLRAEWHDGVARLDLMSTGTVEAMGAADPYTSQAQSAELALLRATTDHTPYPMWHETARGEIEWCNSAYLDLTDAGDDAAEASPWPPERIFDLQSPSETTEAEAPVRCAVSPGGDETRRWFEVTRRPFDDGLLCTAVPADALVRAETSRKEFVTTLSKTFAALPIGLAIFGRNRELTMFNPALVELTALPVPFLVARPSLVSVLDRLRESQMMPEPKDYKSWRHRVSDLVTEARNGTFKETWTLPAGQTYRVTGQPHPDGAVAFLFEDISAEISLTRRYRAEIETGQAALDAMPGAVAIFSTVGVLAMTNAPYGELWTTGDGAEINETSIFDAVRHWKDAAQPSPIWEDIQAAVGHAGRREIWSGEAMLKDGRCLECRVVPLPQGATMVEFTPHRAKKPRRAPKTASAKGAAKRVGAG